MGVAKLERVQPADPEGNLRIEATKEHKANLILPDFEHKRRSFRPGAVTRVSQSGHLRAAIEERICSLPSEQAQGSRFSLQVDRCSDVLPNHEVKNGKK